MKRTFKTTLKIYIDDEVEAIILCFDDDETYQLTLDEAVEARDMLAARIMELNASKDK